MILPKMNIVLGHQSPKYLFIKFCIKYNINPYNYNNLIMFKKHINNIRFL